MHRVAAIAFLAIGCVGTIEIEGGPPPDPASDPTLPDADPAAPDAVPGACDPAVATSNSGKHKAGEACLTCHRSGGSGPAFTLGGTAYTAATGGGPLVGATIRVVDAGGGEAALVSALNGNFWTTQPLQFPVTVRASRCPDERAMSAPVAADGANCNSAGCHDAAFRIHLP